MQKPFGQQILLIMNHSPIIIPFCLAIISASCQKTELKDDSAILAGKWKWSYTIEKQYYAGTMYLHSVDTIYATNYNHQYAIEMQRKGKISLWEDNHCIKYRLIVHEIDYWPSWSGYTGVTNYDHYDKGGFSFTIYDRPIDIMMLSGFPMQQWTSAGGQYEYSYQNYFTREQ